MPSSDPDTIIPPGQNITSALRHKVQLPRTARGRVGALVDAAGTAALRIGQVANDAARVAAHRAASEAAQRPAGPRSGPLGIPAVFVTTAPPEAPAEGGRLVTNTGAAGAAEAERRRQHAPDRTVRRYELQDTARALLPGHRIAHCQHTPTGGLVVVNHHPEHGSASYGGLQTCGSMWACPVCAAKIGARRAEEVDQGAASWQARGGHIYLLTLTLRHDAGRALFQLHAHMNAAYRRMCQGRSWQLAVLRYGLVGRISAREHTHGAAGWHPHLHVLLFSTDDLTPKLADVEQWFAKRWRDCLAELGEDATEEHGTDLRPADDRAGDYIAKLARAWSVPAELAGGQHKEGRRGNRTPVQLLQAAARRDAAAGALYAEYVAATAGTSWLQWTPGLRQLVGLAEEKSDEELAAEQHAEAVALVALTADQWAWVRGNALRGQLLGAACSGDAEYVAGWLQLQGLQVEQRQLWPRWIDADEAAPDSS